jgi:hypothetical protein
MLPYTFVQNGWMFVNLLLYRIIDFWSWSF